MLCGEKASREERGPLPGWLAVREFGDLETGRKPQTSGSPGAKPGDGRGISVSNHPGRTSFIRSCRQRASGISSKQLLGPPEGSPGRPSVRIEKGHLGKEYYS